MFDQQTCAFRSRFRFRRCPSFDVNKWSYESDLKLNLFAAQLRRSGQALNLLEGTRDLLCGLDQRRTLQRPLSSLAPQAHRLLDLPSFSAVTRQQLRAVLGNLGELAFEGFG
ncbi:MAG: hypothetical protein WBD97_05435, partial [Pseudolabrys sp.]